jgi:nucleoside-triphosphatase THEP1
MISSSVDEPREIVASLEGRGEVVRDVVVIDEVGKMELLSEAFEERVRVLFDSGSNNLVLLVTIPASRPKQGSLLHTIRRRRDCRLFEVRCYQAP